MKNLISCSSAPALADDERAFRRTLESINSGGALSHSKLALMYEKGIGTRRSFHKATKHYALAAIYGDINAAKSWRWLMALEGFLWHRGDVFNRW